MAMSMDQMMAKMHARNYTYDMQLAQYFQNISSIFSSKAQGEYEMYQYHAGQAQGMTQPMPGTMGQPAAPGAMGQPQMPGPAGMTQMPGSMGVPQMPGGSMGMPQIPGSMGQPTMPSSAS